MSNINFLQRALSSILPDARLEPCEVLTKNSLKLWVIDPEFCVNGLSSHAAFAVMQEPLYWIFSWASGGVLADLILSEVWNVKNKVLMDVGSGSGVVALAALKAGAKKVIACDLDPLARLAITANAALNRFDTSNLVIMGDFNQFLEPVDIITLSDVLYDKDNFSLLCSLSDRSKHMIIADARVKSFPSSQFKWQGRYSGQTFPDLGGFDEFTEVNIFTQ